jgi:hypothetical protein
MVIEGIIAFVVYIVLQIVVFRLTRQDDASRWTVKLYCLVGAVLFVWSVDEPAVALGSFLVYSGMAAVYILCIFSVVEASLTLRILSEIAGGDKNGTLYTAIFSRYAGNEIIQRRIDRLLRSGDLIYRNGKYYRTNRLTIFKLREHIVTIFKRLFLA